MAFFRNSTVNLLNLHYGIHALALSGGGAFFAAFLLRAGVPAHGVLTAMAAILIGRFLVRPLILPLGRRFGLKPLVIVGTIITALRYPVLAQVEGVGWPLVVLCAFSSVGDTFYWTAYHAYFASLGDAEHRGHQISAREAAVAMVGIVAPLLTGWALVTVGPGVAFGATCIVLMISAVPLLWTPNVEIADEAPGAFRAALAVGGALVIEYLDDTIRTTEDAAQTTALPVLGGILRFGKRRESYKKMLLTNFPSMSPIAESYRLARTNMLFTTEDRKGIFVMTSANPQEGKTVTISNLAVSMAQGGLQVLLIDADLRRPKLHDVFNLENKVGLTTLLFSDPTQANGQQRSDDTLTDLPAAFRQCVQYTGIPKLRVLTSGFIPSNPTEILGSALMAKWIETLSASSSFDIILIDSPPCLAVADSTVRAANTNASVVMVIDCGVTRRGAALKAKDQFAQLGMEVKGVIVNRINPRHESYGYYGYYYAPQYSPNAERKTTTPER